MFGSIKFQKQNKDKQWTHPSIENTKLIFIIRKYIDSGAVCFFEAKTPEVCWLYLQPFVAEKVEQMIATCNNKYVYFLRSVGCCKKLKFK